MKKNVYKVLPAITARTMRGRTELTPRIRGSSWSRLGLVSFAIIVLTACSCRPAGAATLIPLLTDGTCSLGWFPCGENGTVCLEQRFFCDQQGHCPAGEDESDCLDNKGDTHLTQRILDKPVVPWEDRYKCTLKLVPEHCKCRINTRLHCPSAGLKKVPQNLDPDMTALLLTNNSVALEKNSFAKYRKLRLLHLGGNALTEIPGGVFRGLTNLTKLFLMNNHLRDLTPDAFEDLHSLLHLDLTDNRFAQFDSILTYLPALDTVWLNGNLITLKGRRVSPNAQFLQELFLEHNEVEELTKESLIGLSGLHSLYLRYNRISRIEDGSFAQQKLLVDLELNFNRIQYLHADTFLGLDSLVSLNLDGNPLVSLAEATFKRIPLLASLRLYQMELSTELLLNISDAHMDPASPTNLYHVYFKRFRYCGYLPTVPDCWPKTDGVSSFEHLLVRVELRVGVWLVAMLTLMGNMTVLFGRVLNRDDNKILSLFIRNLAVADLCTGVYLLVMASKDLQFRSEYHEHAYYWMSSWECTITGVLAVTSAEVSVMILSFMSVERWVCITWPLGAPKLSLGRAKLALIVIWAAGFVLAIAPVFYYTNKQGFYGTNGLCFPLHLDDPWVPGWIYSAVVFVGLNQLGVVMILISYTWMFCSIRKTRANTPLALGDREFAIRFFFIVFTDCVCWIPIIILRVLALSSTNIPPELYAWVVVVLLPINSAINPFLYTFTTTKFRTHAKRLFSDGANCRWPHRRDSGTMESEVTRTSTLRTATYKCNNGRDAFHLNNGTSQSIDDCALIGVVAKTKEDQQPPAETRL